MRVGMISLLYNPQDHGSYKVSFNSVCYLSILSAYRYQKIQFTIQDSLSYIPIIWNQQPWLNLGSSSENRRM